MSTKRLNGIDLARFIAFVGMVLVNFKIALEISIPDSFSFLSFIEGKAAATFVLLAGVSLTIGSNTIKKISLYKRSIFLICLGTINATIFEADILHYYGIYLLIGSLFITRSNLQIKTAIIFIVLFSYSLLFILDYERGWNWETLDYLDFWTLNGSMRNLMFNGYHPTFPWVAFLLTGMLIGRQNLAKLQTQKRLIKIGSIFLLVSEISSRLFIQLIGHIFKFFDLETASALFGTSPMPPTPLYVMTGIGSGLLILGLALYFEQYKIFYKVMRPFSQTGKMALTLYISHILFGLGTLEYFGYLDKPQPLSILAYSAISFITISILFCNIWLSIFKRGPIEKIMRSFSH